MKNRMNKYQELGYSSRTEYLQGLAEDYGMDCQTVQDMAEALGEAEDFDGLVTAIEMQADTHCVPDMAAWVNEQIQKTGEAPCPKTP